MVVKEVAAAERKRYNFHPNSENLYRIDNFYGTCCVFLHLYAYYRMIFPEYNEVFLPFWGEFV